MNYCIKPPQYKKDVLQHLQHCDATPAALMFICDYIEGVKQSISRAADEIERLRAENKALKKALKK